MAVILREQIEYALGGTLAEVKGRNEVLQILKKVDLLRNLPLRILRCIAGAVRIQECQPQEVIFAQDEPGNAFYLVKSGYVNIV